MDSNTTLDDNDINIDILNDKKRENKEKYDKYIKHLKRIKRKQKIKNQQNKCIIM